MADDKNRSYRLQLNVCWLLFFRPRPLDHYYLCLWDVGTSHVHSLSPQSCGEPQPSLATLLLKLGDGLLRPSQGRPGQHSVAYAVSLCTRRLQQWDTP